MSSKIAKTAAVANSCEAMEAETISKNGASPKNIMSRNFYFIFISMKKLYIIFICGLMCAANIHAQTWNIGHHNAADVIATFDNGTLIITGSGAMQDWAEGETPYWDKKDEITDIVINTGVTTIGTFAFIHCSNLVIVSIPNSIAAIHDWAFAWCPSLSSISIPNSVTIIGNHVFDNCASLSDVYVGWTEPLSVPPFVFLSSPISNANLHIPEGTLCAYANAPVWQNFNIVVQSSSGIVNDLCVNATDLSCGTFSISVQGTLAGATPTTSIIYSKGADKNDVFYYFKAPNTGNYRISLTKFNYSDEIDLHIYTDCNATTAIAEITDNGSTETITITFNAETTYYIRIVDRNGTGGNFKIKLEKLYVHESEHFRLEIEQNLISISPEQLSEWLANLDRFYVQLVDLMSGMKPFEGNKMIIRSEGGIGAWAFAGNPIVWNSDFVSGTLNDFVSNGNWSFGILHEIGHNFANYIGGYGSRNNSYNWNEESFANFRMYLALSQIPDSKVETGGAIRHGAEVAEYCQRDFDCKTRHNTPLTGDAHMWTFIRLGNYYQKNNDHGFWLYKKAFEIINTRNGEDDHTWTGWQRFNYFLDILSSCVGSDVRETFSAEEMRLIRFGLDISTCYDYTLSLPATTWQTHSSSIQSGDYYVYRVPVIEGHKYTFKTCCEDGASATFDATLSLFYHPPGNRIYPDLWDGDICASDAGITKIEDFQFNYSGYAYLKVDGVGGSYGNYTIAYKTDQITELSWEIGYPNAADVIATLDNGTLTISGTGNMQDFEGNKQPWYPVRVAIKTLEIQGVSNIGANAFSNCEELTSVNIPNTVTSIEYAAFHGCSSLTFVSIPNSVTSIGACPFHACSSLVSIQVDDNNTEYCSENGVLFNKEKTILIQYPLAKKENNYTIPNSVVTIKNDAFNGCNGLNSVQIPNSVKIIEHAAFYSSGLHFVIIPPSVMFIGNVAFSGCYNLTSITFPDSEITMEDHAFVSCHNLTEIINHATMPQAINANVFEGVFKSACTLWVPAGSEDDYRAAEGWKDFVIKTITTGDAQTPNITEHPQGTTYNQNTAATALTVTASITDSGTLSYKWYSNTADNNTDGTMIDGATGTSYTPPTTTVGTWYYYVVVTNTNNSVSGTKTAIATSNTAAISIVAQQVTSVEVADVPLAHVYPNPTYDAVTLQFEVIGEYLVTLSDISGKILLRQTTGDQSMRLDMSSFPKGVYLLTIDDGKRHNTTRIVKN